MVSGVILTGQLALVGMILTMIFGMLMRKGRWAFISHKVFATLTLLLALLHAYLVLF